MKRGAVAAIFAIILCRAQTPTGAIEGTILDASQSPIPGAAVSIIEAATGRTIAFASDESGRYSARNLLPGSYTVKVEAAGFSSALLESIPVDAGAVVSADIKMRIGMLTEVIAVSASAVAIDTVRQTVDSIITEREIRNIPLFNRNFLDLAALAPGVFVRDGANIDPTKSIAYRAVGISGRSGQGTKILIDGIDVSDAIAGSTVANLSNDAVHEFQLSRSSLDVSGPMTSSGSVSIISKSGGNRIHGGGFWDYYNQDMGARLDYNAKSEPFHRQRGGVSAGGPFVKDKLFWFVNWERSSQELQAIFKAPEFPQLNVSQGVPIGIRYAKGRVDWNLTPSVRLFYSFQNDWNLAAGGSAVSSYESVNWGNMHTVALDINRARSTHSLRLGYVRYNNRIQPEERQIPFPRTPQGVPFFLGVGTFQAGPNKLAPQATMESLRQSSYNGSFFRGRHTLRYGVSLNRVAIGGFVNLAGPLSVTGTFDAATVAQVRAHGGNVQDPLEYPFQSFTTGPNNGYLFLDPAFGLPHGGHFDTRTSWYAGDTFKLNRRLTVNLGLRWEYDTGYFDNNPKVKRDPVLDTWIPGASQVPVMPKNLFSPSFGFVYDPAGTGKTVIRGGFYKGYEANIYNNLLSDEYAMLPPGIGPDLYSYTSVTGPDGRPINVDGKHPNGDYSDLQGQPIKNAIGLIGQVHQALQTAYKNYTFDPGKGASVFTLTKGNTGTLFPGSQYKIPYSLQFNIGVQREVKAGTVLSVDYVYNHGIGLPFFQADYERRRDAATLNPAVARAQVNRVLAGQSVDQWIAANPTRNISAFSLVSDAIWQGLTPDFLAARFVTGGFTKYGGLQASLRGARASLGFLKDASYLVSYAVARAESTAAASNIELLASGTVRNNRQWNDRATFGPTGLDYTHQLSAAVVFRAPGAIRLSSRWTFRSARPLNIVVPNLGGAISGVQGFFGTDLNGDGGTNAPYNDVLPGVAAGQFGRGVKSFSDLNRIITSFNQNYGGKLTPHGQALVDAGLFTEAQLKRLGAVIPTIPLVPENNPYPFHNLFTTDLRVDRPIRLGRWREGVQVSPFVDFLNLFNHAPVNSYGGLAARFGQLNFDYANAPAGQQASDLNFQSSRLSTTRKLQIGIRVDF